MVIIAYLWSSVLWLAIPDEEVGGVNWRWLIVFVPLACALGMNEMTSIDYMLINLCFCIIVVMFVSVGVWTVGNIGREEGTIHWALFGAYATLPLYWLLEDDSTWYTLMTFVSALAFDTKSKQWRRKPKQQKSLLK